MRITLFPRIKSQIVISYSKLTSLFNYYSINPVFQEPAKKGANIVQYHYITVILAQTGLLETYLMKERLFAIPEIINILLQLIIQVNFIYQLLMGGLTIHTKYFRIHLIRLSIVDLAMMEDIQLLVISWEIFIYIPTIVSQKFVLKGNMIMQESVHHALLWHIALIVPQELVALPAHPTTILMLDLVEVVELLLSV